MIKISRHAVTMGRSDSYSTDPAELVALATVSHQLKIQYLEEIPADEFVRLRMIATLLPVESKDENEHRASINGVQKTAG